MITTQYGNAVKILATLGSGWVKVKRLSDGAIRQWHVCNLRGDTDADLAELNGFRCGDVSNHTDVK